MGEQDVVASLQGCVITQLQSGCVLAGDITLPSEFHGSLMVAQCLTRSPSSTLTASV